MIDQAHTISNDDLFQVLAEDPAGLSPPPLTINKGEKVGGEPGVQEGEHVDVEQLVLGEVLAEVKHSEKVSNVGSIKLSAWDRG